MEWGKRRGFRNFSGGGSSARYGAPRLFYQDGTVIHHDTEVCRLVEHIDGLFERALKLIDKVKMLVEQFVVTADNVDSIPSTQLFQNGTQGGIIKIHHALAPAGIVARIDRLHAPCAIAETGILVGREGESARRCLHLDAALDQRDVDVVGIIAAYIELGAQHPGDDAFGLDDEGVRGIVGHIEVCLAV